MSLKPISQAQKNYRALTPQEIKSERDTKIKVYAAAAFCLIALAAGIYLTQNGFSSPQVSPAAAGGLVGGIYLLGTSSIATLTLTLYGLSKDADRERFSGIRPDLSDAKIRQDRISFLKTKPLSEVYRQLYIREVGVTPYVQAGLLTIQEGDELSKKLNEWKAALDVINQVEGILIWENRNMTTSKPKLEDNPQVQDAKTKLTALEKEWLICQRASFKLPKGHFDAADIKSV